MAKGGRKGRRKQGDSSSSSSDEEEKQHSSKKEDGDLDFAQRRELQRKVAAEKRLAKRKCHVCGKFGHVRRTCPGIADGGSGASKFTKKKGDPGAVVLKQGGKKPFLASPRKSAFFRASNGVCDQLYPKWRARMVLKPPHHDPRLSLEGYGFSETENERYLDEERHSSIRRPRHKRDDLRSSSQNSKDSYVSSDEGIDTAPTVPQQHDETIIVVSATPELLLDIRISH